MKRNLLFMAIVSMFIVSPLMAAVTLEESTDAEFLINSGYSQALAEDVFMQKNRVTGKPAEALYDKSGNFLIRGWRRLFSYIDPAQDTYDRIHHDIRLEPHPSDL